MAQSSGSFVWYELMTTQTGAAKAFYTNVLGWGAQGAAMSGSTYHLLTVEDTPVAGLTRLPEEARRTGIAAHWIGYIGVDDIDAATLRVAALGGTVYLPPTDVPKISRFSIIADPQGTSLGLISGLKPRETPSSFARDCDDLGSKQSKIMKLDAGEKPASAFSHPSLATPGRGGWHELLASNWEEAFTFYAALFGWQKVKAQQGLMGTYQQFSAGGETIGGMFTKPQTLPHPFWLYYFNVADIEAAAQRVEAGGGEILYGPIEVPGGNWILHCTDPQGAIFALLERRTRKAVGYFVPGFPDTSRTR
jgi:predicted enzyme related to lactoylglutathione lyase